ncbi:UNVERIFIED_CONTAM: hypothetical protein Slati_2635400 [Sesamum latifolium]|uniref:Reverse transcriptase domain-containing protein n=1 Tax=Sesamum latifolium TaxID=2727402 RepID=A0AAW2VVT9_9LAMI
MGGPVTSEEVRAAVFDMDINNIAGPDGFNALFYQCCWDVIQQDIIEAVQDFMNGTSLPKTFIVTSLVLIPKLMNPIQWGDFRTISLCNTSNKILSKLLNERLKRWLPELVLPNQSGFVATWKIGDNIVLAQEIIHSIASHKSDMNMALKLDMTKAYDRVD